MEDQNSSQLIRNSRERYGDTFNAVLFEQYRHYVESAEKISERRVTSNNYLLTVNVSLVSLYGIVTASAVTSNWIALLPIAGLIVSVTWYRIITSYRNLNSVKYLVIHDLEQYMPAALYDYEWQKAGAGLGRQYRPVSNLEAWVPITFMLLYLVLAGAGVVDFVYSMRAASP